MNNIFKSILILTGPSIVIYIFVVLYFYFFQNDIIYKYSDNKFNKQSIEKDIPNIKFHKTELGYKYAFKPSSNGKYIIYYHGRSGNMSTSASNASHFDKLGFGTILCSYPGYDENIGTPNRTSLEKASVDCFNVLKNNSIKHENTIVHGVSMGSYFASYAAMNQNIYKLSLVSPMGSLSESASIKHPYLPINLILKDDLVTYKNIVNISSKLELYYHFKDLKTPLQQGYNIFAKHNIGDNKKFLYTLNEIIEGDDINYHGDELHKVKFVINKISEAE